MSVFIHDARQQVLIQAAPVHADAHRLLVLAGEFDHLRELFVALSAVPYRFNAQLAEWAIESGASFLDLGGNTAVVRKELALHKRAKKAGVSIVPDCGLAPGLPGEACTDWLSRRNCIATSKVIAPERTRSSSAPC